MTIEPLRPMAAADNWNFLRLWFRDPLGIGAVAPSSQVLSAAMARAVEFDRPGVVIELGGGTGRITAALAARARSPGDIVVIEREPSLCALLAARFPRIRIIRGDARDLGSLIADAGIGEVNDIVSGLPLLAMPQEFRREIVAQSVALLPRGGRFIQFTYGPASPISREVAAEMGIAARRSGWILRNLPPASVWLYERMDGPEAGHGDGRRAA